ncbi:hypothetical protein HanHA300_Chr06g0218521 [Helianthus annuus]|nr:hypothetical protein HanHA300_Chr06g0218521 [Helianthus annuus]KAJ0574094.1 hypothetical protein HanHA89_Chr06g0234271 [Helianthus annuus]KAJ0738429.1 hypothetical protein HanLR1_Chr06g0218201 [Helianthus annuus]
MEAFPILRLIYNLLLLIGGFKGSFKSPALFYLHHPLKVKHLFASDGSVDYYAAMTHRDRLFHCRRLAAATVESSLAFLDGNETYQLQSLGLLIRYK